MRLKLIICAVAMTALSSSLRAEDDSPKQQILAAAKQMALSDEQFQAFDKKIEKKLIETPFSEQDIAEKPELTQIYEIYQKAINDHRANLRTQYDLGQKMIQQVQETDELSRLGEIVHAFQAAISPVLEEHKALEEKIKDLEGKIIPLLPPGTELYY